MTTTRSEQRWCRAHNITPAGLKLLIFAIGNAGVAGGRGAGTGAGTTRQGLQRRGLVTLGGGWDGAKFIYPMITGCGRDLVTAARRAGL